MKKISRNKRKFYHASPKRLKVGTIIAAPSDTKDRSTNLAALGYNDMNVVYLTNSPIPHKSIMEMAYKDGWHIYEVKPIGKVKMGEFEEFTTLQAEVVKYVGNARGLARNYLRNNRSRIKDLGSKTVTIGDNEYKVDVGGILLAETGSEVKQRRYRNDKFASLVRSAQIISKRYDDRKINYYEYKTQMDKLMKQVPQSRKMEFVMLFLNDKNI